MNKIKEALVNSLDKNREFLNIEKLFNFNRSENLCFEDIEKKLIEDVLPQNLKNIKNYSAFREIYIETFGYASITRDFINELSDFLKDKKVLEIMSGKGAISYFLKENGIDIAC